MIPMGFLVIASKLHDVSQGAGYSQCMQTTGLSMPFSSILSILIRERVLLHSPSFPKVQAMTHILHPVHLFLSTRKAYLFNKGHLLISLWVCDSSFIMKCLCYI